MSKLTQAQKDVKNAKAKAKRAEAKAAKAAVMVNGAKAKRAKAKAEKAPRTRSTIANGVRKPLNPDSKCGQVWAIADRLTKKVKGTVQIPTIRQMFMETDKVGLNANNVKIEYVCWRKFYGHAAIWTGKAVAETAEAA